MADSTSNVQPSDQPPADKELDLASEIFHQINRVIPKGQKLLTVAPDCRVYDAVAKMRKYGYSQVPVVKNGEVLGVFSFRSFALGAANVTLEDWTRQKCAPGDLQVDEFMEDFEFARVKDEMSRLFNAMDKADGILIGTHENLIAIVTPMDFLYYFYKVASPFVMISEIELALRALIRFALNEEQIAVAAKRSLSSLYAGEDKVPTSLEDMTFDNYQSLISHSENWTELEHIFGGTRARVSGKLKEIRDIRNNIFHFRREITMQEHESLATHRNWLLNKIRQVGTTTSDTEAQL